MLVRLRSFRVERRRRTCSWVGWSLVTVPSSSCSALLSSKNRARSILSLKVVALPKLRGQIADVNLQATREAGGTQEKPVER